MRTTGKSKKSAKANDLPTQAHYDQAAKAAREYRFTLWQEDGEWYSRCVELPLCMGDGKTPEAAIAAGREAVVAGLGADLAAGMSAPPPAREGIRNEQVNVRLSADERAQIEANAARAGFKGLADYIRAVALGFPHMAQ
jgi:predicted RNase H-like HicB family nuclease